MRLTPVPSGILQVNTWIVPLTGSKALVIDPAACKFSHDETAILSYLDKNRLEPCGFLLTHGHFDHITGTRILKDRFPNCKIAVHKKDAPMCGSQARAVQGAVFDSMGLSYLYESIENLPDADILISGGETLDRVFAAEEKNDMPLLNSLKEWKVIHSPGHTPGSVCIYNAAEKTLISGDTVFYHSWGRTDLPGGNDAEMMQSFSMLSKTLPPDTLVYPGHETYGFTLGGNF